MLLKLPHISTIPTLLWSVYRIVQLGQVCVNFQERLELNPHPNNLALEWKFFWFAAGMSSLGDLHFIHNSFSALIILGMICNAGFL